MDIYRRRRSSFKANATVVVGAAVVPRALASRDTRSITVKVHDDISTKLSMMRLSVDRNLGKDHVIVNDSHRQLTQPVNQNGNSSSSFGGIEENSQKMSHKKK